MKLKYLGKYGNMFADLSEQIRTDLLTKSDKELIEIINETKILTGTNCSWTTYRISSTVREYAGSILKEREEGAM